MSNKSKEELSELAMYRLWVEKLAKSESADIEYNSGPGHAMIVLENIFQSARDQVNIIAGSFDDEVCVLEDSKYISSLKSFLLRGGRINVLLTDLVTEQTNKTLGVLSQYSLHKDLKEKIIVKTSSEKTEDNGNEYHLTIADNKIIRYEYDTKRFAARFSFNQPKLVEFYNNKFLDLFNNPNNKPVELNNFLPSA